MEPEGFAELLGAIYDAALEPAAWGGLAVSLGRFVDASSCTLQLRDADFNVVGPLVTTTTVDAATVAAYVTHYGRLDPWATGWIRQNKPNIYSGHSLTDQSKVEESEYYRDFARFLGTFHFLGATLYPFGAGAPSLALSLHRPIDSADFEDAARQRMTMALPHLRRALQLGKAFADADQHRHAAQDALERLALGLIVVGADARIVSANREGERILREGTALAISGGRLRATEPAQQAALLEMLRRASVVARGQAARATDILSLPRAERPPLSVLVTPLTVAPKFRAFGAGVAAVFVQDPERHRPPSAAALAARYRLTPAEGRLLQALIVGERAQDYAERAGVTLNTVNTQMKHLFAKTDTNRQSDLVALALRDLVARLADGGG